MSTADPVLSLSSLREEYPALKEPGEEGLHTRHETRLGWRPPPWSHGPT